MKNDIKDLIELIFDTKKMISDKIRADGDKCMTFGQAKALRFIKDKKNPTMKEVSDFLGITPPSTTALVGCFIKNKLIKRTYSKRDRRISHLEVTSLGRKKIDESSKKIKEKIREIFMRLDDRQIKNFKEILRTLLGKK